MCLSDSWRRALSLTSLSLGPRPSQELLKDGKRETTISQLLINPTDLDIGRVFTCRSSNEAIPGGKETSIELDVHREKDPGEAGAGQGAMGKNGKCTEEPSGQSSLRQEWL